MKLLVTGGTGVVGTGTVTELLRRGHIVVLLSRHAQADSRQWESGVTPFPGDVSDEATIRGAGDGCDVVLHMVGIVDESGASTFQRVNVNGTANLLAESERAGIRRFIFVSSLGAPRGESGYHRSKREAEALVRQARGSWTICRPGNVYGPGDEQISTILRLVRAPTPLVPKVGSGDQPFQPIWWEDLARALATVVEREDLAGRELDIAGGEVTSQNDILARLSQITGRNVHGVPVPEFIAGIGAKLVGMVGWDLGINEQGLTMLQEGNVIADGETNALTAVLMVEPTSLDVGLRQLVDMQPEQLPSDGVGTLKRKRYWADIAGGKFSPEALFALFRTHFNEVTPVFVDMNAEQTGDQIDEGQSITMSLPMRGHVQVRVAGLEPCRVTLLTVEGHPLAGAVRFICESRGECVRFQVEAYDRAANVIDLIAMRSIGDRMQDQTWMQVVEQMVDLSRGSAAAGLQHDSASLDEEEAKLIEAWIEELALARKRAEHTEQIQGAA